LGLQLGLPSAARKTAIIRRMERVAVQRYHSLDALRAAMMLLGLVLHSAASYTDTALGSAWPFRDRQTSVAFDLVIFFIHLFRMPAFFVVAGFFGALLYYRSGAAGFARNRGRRVLLPLVIFWGLMMPIVAFGFIFSIRQVGAEMPWGDITGKPLQRQPILGHLWFLYYLLIFYIVAAAAVPMARAVGARLRKRSYSVVRAIAARWWGPLVLAAITMVTLIPMEAAGLDTAAALVPPIRVLVAYGVFFAFGWCLFSHRDLIPRFADRWKPMLVTGIAASAGYLFVVVAQTGFTDATVWHFTAIALAAPAIWFIIFGTMGLFVRYMEKPRPLVRYLSDASYWMYLTHLGPAAWLPGILAHVDAPAVVKFSLVLGLTTFSTLITYHYFVRSTFIGELLNGRRYPRALPELAPAGV
jgi:glucans biosynthesis protein C